MKKIDSKLTPSAVSAAALTLANAIMMAGTMQAQSTPIQVAFADGVQKLPELVVGDKREAQTGLPKYTEPLRDTPQTVVVIPQEVYTQQGATSLSSVLRNTPGITFAAGEGGSAASTAGDSFYMRGFDTTNNIFIDGVRDVGAYSRDVFDVQEVEVIKGPAGSDVGRGAASGYVNLVTKVPHLENFAAGTLSYGFDEKTSNDRRRATLDVNQPLDSVPVKGSALRLNAMWQDNGIVGRDYAKNKGWSVAPSLALGLGTPNRAYLYYSHTKQDNLPDYGLPTPAFPGYVTTPPAPPIAWHKFYGLLSDFDRVENDMYTARLEHDFTSDLKISNQTRYDYTRREAIVTTPGSNATSYNAATGLLTRSRQANKQNSEILSNQTNATAKLTTGSLQHDLSSGLEVSREKSYSPAFTTVSLTPIPVNNPNPNASPSGTPTRTGASSNAKTNTLALYAFDAAKFGQHWEVDGGLRWEHYKTTFFSVPVPGAGVPAQIAAADDILSWKGGLVFKPAPNGSIYAAAGISLTPPGTTFTLSSAAGNQNNPSTAPQRTTSYETGTKWDFFKGRLSTTAAVFQTENDNTVFTDPVLGPIPTGKQTVKGVELGVSGKITYDWLVFGGYSYLDSKIDNGLTAGNNAAGADLPLIPRNSGNFWTTYRLPFGLTLGGGTQYVSATNRRDATTAVPRTMPSYWLFNAVASYEVNGHLTLRLNLNNVFDKQYVQSFNNNGGRFNPGAPRSVLVSAEMKF